MDGTRRRIKGRDPRSPLAYLWMESPRSMHPSEAIRGRKSQLLSGRRIVVGISGSIAAIETPRLIRELLRHGAQVDAVMSRDALAILTTEAVRFATGRPPVTEITGDVEHVRLLGPGPQRADLFLVAPATANTLAKIAHGIDDTPVTTCASVALGGGVPVLIAPAMHADMERSPFVQDNIRRLEGAGVHFIPPYFEEGEAKLAPPEVVAAHVMHTLAKGPWAGRRVRLIGGSTSEPLDEVRAITNEGSGQMASALATQLFYRGAVVEAWIGEVRVPWPSYIPTRRFRTLEDLQALRQSSGARWKEVDALIVPAALSDYTVRPHKGKIPSEENPRLSVILDRAAKLLPQLRKDLRSNALLVAFKLEVGLSPGELITKARAWREGQGAQAVVANGRSTMGSPNAEVVLVRAEGKAHPYAGPKEIVAGKLLDDLARDLPGPTGADH